jgi:hypothetical protein
MGRINALAGEASARHGAGESEVPLLFRAVLATNKVVAFKRWQAGLLQAQKGSLVLPLPVDQLIPAAVALLGTAMCMGRTRGWAGGVSARHGAGESKMLLLVLVRVVCVSHRLLLSADGMLAGWQAWKGSVMLVCCQQLWLCWALPCAWQKQEVGLEEPQPSMVQVRAKCCCCFDLYLLLKGCGFQQMAGWLGASTEGVLSPTSCQLIPAAVALLGTAMCMAITGGWAGGASAKHGAGESGGFLLL